MSDNRSTEDVTHDWTNESLSKRETSLQSVAGIIVDPEIDIYGVVTWKKAAFKQTDVNAHDVYIPRRFPLYPTPFPSYRPVSPSHSSIFIRVSLSLSLSLSFSLSRVRTRLPRIRIRLLVLEW